MSGFPQSGPYDLLELLSFLILFLGLLSLAAAFTEHFLIRLVSISYKRFPEFGCLNLWNVDPARPLQFH